MQRQHGAHERALAGRAGDAERAVDAPTRSARPLRPEPVLGVRAADAVVLDLDDERVVVVREPDRRVGRVRVLGDVRERLGDREVRGRLGDGREPPVGQRRRPRPAPARAPPASRSRGRGRGRSAPRGGCRGRARAARPRPARAPRRGARGTGPPTPGSRSIRARATRTSSASVTSRCWAPSWRSRSILRRAASAASTMRAREACSSAARAASTSRRRSASSASRRSVMSKIAPSIHRRPPGPRTSWPRSSTQRTTPSARTIRYSTTKAPSSASARGDRLQHALAVVGMDDAHDRPLRARDEVLRRVARDPLDLVADQRERVVGVPRRAVDRARDVDHQRAQQRVVGALLRRAHAGARAGEQLGAREGPGQVVVGAGVQRGDGGLRVLAVGDREQPRLAQAGVVAQRHADPASRPPGSPSTRISWAGASASAFSAAFASATTRYS